MDCLILFVSYRRQSVNSAIRSARHVTFAILNQPSSHPEHFNPIFEQKGWHNQLAALTEADDLFQHRKSMANDVIQHNHTILHKF